MYAGDRNALGHTHANSKNRANRPNGMVFPSFDKPTGWYATSNNYAKNNGMIYGKANAMPTKRTNRETGAIIFLVSDYQREANDRWRPLYGRSRAIP